MSFALTTAQVRARTKTVTRRLGWTSLRPGDLVRAVVKCQGLKKGDTVEPLAVLRVVDVRREPLRRLIEDLAYGFEELRLEGFDFRRPIPGVEAYWYYPESFVEMFLATHRGCTLHDDVTRIAFAYADADDAFGLGA